jgi:uncharacterized protein (TIGR02271 family)
VLAADTAPSSLAGLEVVDRRGERLGRVRQVYRDGTGLGWVGVRGNLFGTEEVLVPLVGAVVEDDVLGVAVLRAGFQSAPRRRPDSALQHDERERLRAFWSEAGVDEVPPASAGTGAEPAAERFQEDPGVMTASEERLRVETERVPRSRVRLQKVVVTEQRTVTVALRREEYRLVREAIADGEPVPGGSIGPAEQEVVLYEERAVVTTEVVPVERIRLVKEEVVDTREISSQVRRERIDLVVPAGEGAEPEAQPEPEPAQPSVARAISTKRATSRRSPRKLGSTAARSSTSAAAEAPPSTGASD